LSANGRAALGDQDGHSLVVIAHNTRVFKGDRQLLQHGTFPCLEMPPLHCVAGGRFQPLAVWRISPTIQDRGSSISQRRRVGCERRVRRECARSKATQKEPAMATTKDYSGALFKNSRKDEGGPNAPDYTGDVLIAGVRYRLAGWMKERARQVPVALS